jgi:membrane dipeptidase
VGEGNGVPLKEDVTHPFRPPVTRREVLAALGALALGACAARTGSDVLASDAETVSLLDTVIGVDMHSHAAGANGRRTPGYDLAARMRSGRMTAVCLQHAADSPVLRRDSQNRIVVLREPGPGELWRLTQNRLAWIDSLIETQGLRRALGRGDIEAAHRDRAPAIVQAIEGCQFMEGRLERIGEVHRRGVRHLQLVHFMPSDLGDNQTEIPRHGGLTPLGRDVIAECNRLGVVVDVAHGTLALVEGAARASRTPLILSHTNLAAGPLRPLTRLIDGDHGKLVASTGGVVGIWASPSFRSLSHYVDGVARAAEILGVEHVGLGTDNSGFGTSEAVWTDYADFPIVVQLLRRVGFSATDVGKLAGGNYVRVFNQSVHPATGA